MRKIGTLLILFLNSMLLSACSTTKMPKDIIQNNMVAEEKNIGMQMFYKNQEEDMLNGIYVTYKNKTSFYNWVNVNNETYYPRIHILDNANAAISLVTGYGSGVLQSELHIINLQSFEEIEYDNPLEIISKNIAMEYKENMLMINNNGVVSYMDLPEEDMENLFQEAGVGGFIKYEVINNQLCALVGIQVTPAHYAGNIEIKYKLENDKYVFDFLEIQGENNVTQTAQNSLKSTENYSNNSIQFSYPADMSLVEKTGEDGKTINIFQDNMEVFLIHISQGEAWRVNLEYAEEEYKELLAESYKDIEVTEFAEMNIDGNDAIRIEFKYEVGDKKYIGLKYLVITGYSGFEFTCEYLEESPYEKKFESIISSIKFI